MPLDGRFQSTPFKESTQMAQKESSPDKHLQRATPTMKTWKLKETQPTPTVTDSPTLSQLALHRDCCGFVARNPKPVRKLFQILTSLITYPTPIPNPIAINFSCSLWKVDCHSITLGVAQKISLTPDLNHDTPLVQNCLLEVIAHSVTLRKSHSINDLSYRLPEHSFINEKTDKSPERPKTAIISSCRLLPNQAQLEPILSSLQPKKQPSHTCELLDGSQASQPLEHFSAPLEDTQQIDAEELVLNCSNSHEATLQMNVENQQNTEMSPVNPSDANPPEINLLPPTKHLKERNTPVRRSQRLQAKQKEIVSTSKLPGKAKNKMLNISFTDDSHLLPLDANETFEILQATGLQITKKIEDLIDEALQKDQLSDQAMPHTPLHDPIPPFAIPGTDMFL